MKLKNAMEEKLIKLYTRHIIDIVFEISVNFILFFTVLILKPWYSVSIPGKVFITFCILIVFIPLLYNMIIAMVILIEVKYCTKNKATILVLTVIENRYTWFNRCRYYTIYATEIGKPHKKQKFYYIPSNDNPLFVQEQYEICYLSTTKAIVEANLLPSKRSRRKLIKNNSNMACYIKYMEPNLYQNELMAINSFSLSVYSPRESEVV